MKHLLIVTCFVLAVSSTVASGAEVLRAGIIGCDTSHVPAFTRLINDPDASGARAQVEVVVAYPGGSPDLAESRDRVEEYTEQIRSAGVEIVDSIDKLVERCDVILIESVDGRVHLDQFRKAARGKPVFIDKPAAAALADVLRIGEVAKQTGTPLFSSSALRYCESITPLKAAAQKERLLGCTVASPYRIEPTHSDFFWYGVHGVESLFTLMGTGCEEVRCTETESAAVVVGQWNDGRLATYRGIKQGKTDYYFVTFGEQTITQGRGISGYQPLVEEICKFFVSGKAPVSWDETVEIFTFMEAAKVSRERNGEPVRLEEILAKVRKEAGER